MHVEDTTIEQALKEAPEVEDLTDEALDRAPGKGGFAVLGLTSCR